MSRWPEFLLAVAVVALFSMALAGCTEKSGTVNATATSIDDALRDGPVLVEFGAAWCGWCEREKPVIANLSRDVRGVTFVYIDVDVNRSLADDYYVGGVPQMDLIVKKNRDGSYLYVDRSGATTTDRYASRLVGYMDYGELKPLLDAALRAR